MQLQLHYLVSCNLYLSITLRNVIKWISFLNLENKCRYEQYINLHGFIHSNVLSPFQSAFKYFVLRFLEHFHEVLIHPASLS